MPGPKRPRQHLMRHGGLEVFASICGHQLRRRRRRKCKWSAGLMSCNNSPVLCSCSGSASFLLLLAAALRGEPTAKLRRDFTTIVPQPHVHP